MRQHPATTALTLFAPRPAVSSTPLADPTSIPSSSSLPSFAPMPPPEFPLWTLGIIIPIAVIGLVAMVYFAYRHQRMMPLFNAVMSARHYDGAVYVVMPAQGIHPAAPSASASLPGSTSAANLVINFSRRD